MEEIEPMSRNCLKLYLMHAHKQGYFCDGTYCDAILEALSQKDANRNGVPESFFWHQFYEVRCVLLSYHPFFFKQTGIFCTVLERKTNPSSPTNFFCHFSIPEPISLEKYHCA
jgi:hypothetical protein